MRPLTAVSAIALALSIFVAPLPLAAAEPVFCTARIDGKDVAMAYDKDEPSLRENYSRREIMFTRWGRDTCPSYVVLRSLTPDLTDEERGPFCLRHDKDSDSIIGYDVGRRDSYGRCEEPRRSVCQRVNQTRDASVAIAGAAARRTFNGVETVASTRSGAIILSGTASTISGALGSIGGAAATVASAPAVLAGAAVTVVAVGGAVYACSD